jgi:hypothetical protein
MVKNEEFCMLTFDSFMAGFGRFGPKKAVLSYHQPIIFKKYLELSLIHDLAYRYAPFQKACCGSACAERIMM